MDLLLGTISGQLYGGGSTPPSEPTPSTMRRSFYSKTSGGTEAIVIKEPAGYGDTPGKQYPLHMFYHGDGGDGTFSVNTNQAMSTSGSNLYTITANNSSGGRRVFYPSIIFKVAGAEVARARLDMNGTTATVYSTGAISGITGTVNISTYPNTTMSIQFPAAPGGAVTVDYDTSTLFEAGLPMYLNQGSYDWDETIVVMVQKAANDTYYDPVDHYEDLREHMISNYPINVNRITVSGLSRGGFFCVSLLENTTYFSQIAGFITVSAGGVSMADWNTLSNKGYMYVAGQNEAPTYPVACGTILNATGALNLRNYPAVIMVQGTGHTGTVWNTNVYNINTALFDFRDWLDRWSLDYNDQATRHVEKAEAKLDIDRWREAKRAVYYMSAGTEKTALEARLAALKTTLDNSKQAWVLDFGANSDSELYLNTNYINTNFQTGTTYSSLKDDNNNVTGVGLNVISQFATSPTNRFATTTRGANAQFGFTQANYNDGLNWQTTVTTGQFKLTGLSTSKTYKLKFFLANGSTSTAHNMSVSITVGSTTKTAFTTYTNRRTVEFTGITPNGSGEIIISGYASGDTTTVVQALRLNEE